MSGSKPVAPTIFASIFLVFGDVYCDEKFLSRSCVGVVGGSLLVASSNLNFFSRFL